MDRPKYRLSFRRAKRPGAFTLLEVLVALFILLLGVVGVLAAMPTGVANAEWVIFQDAAINLGHSKFAEFRRDRANPGSDLQNGSPYLDNMAPVLAGDVNNYRPFISAAASPAVQQASPYYFFDEIWNYAWKVDVQPVNYGVNNQPTFASTNINCYAVTVTIRIGGAKATGVSNPNTHWRSFSFTQIMTPYQ